MDGDLIVKQKVDELNYKYQFVKNNKYWNYDKEYKLDIAGQEYKINENDILFGIANNIANNVSDVNDNRNDMSNYLTVDVDSSKMKEIVTDFFVNINPKWQEKVDFIFDHTNFIKYDDNIPSNEQRSVTNQKGIKFYYKNDLTSLVTLAHEVSHAIANLTDNLEIKNGNKVEAFDEVESEMTEDMFLEYLKNSDLSFVDNSSSSIRNLNDNDLDDIKYNKYKSALFLSYRVLDEVGFKKYVKDNNIKDLNYDVINELALSMNISKTDVMSRLDLFIDKYYPSDKVIHNYVGCNSYDLKNGEQLSNECRFIYAFCFVEKFNNMDLDYDNRCEFYKNYLDNVGNMSFQDTLSEFNVDLGNVNSFSNEFINKFNGLANKDNLVIQNTK